MSAPLVVNTTDGTVWTRREETRGGEPLYALAGCARCPEIVMATYAELEEHGIAGSADVLPVPVGPEPQADDRAKAPWGRGEDGRPLLPMGAHWTDIPELVDGHLAGIQARLDQAQPGSWYVASTAETWRAPGTVCTRVDGYHRTVGQFTNVSDADLELVLRAHDDLNWCLEMIAKLRARVAELEAERHSTNESLSEAAEALRADRDRIARLERSSEGLSFAERAQRETHPGRRRAWQMLAQIDESERVYERLAGRSVEESADKLTRLLAPSSLEDPHDSPLHHTYKVPRDLPPVGGAS